MEEKVRQLTREEIDDITVHYDAALYNDTGSGDHWILMAVLDKYGFRTMSPTKAMEVAEEVITRWYQLHR